MRWTVMRAMTEVRMTNQKPPHRLTHPPPPFHVVLAVVGRNVSFVEDWPKYSPDLNLQENLWSWMSNSLAGKIFKSIDEFKAAVQRQWDSISDKYLQSLYRSLPKRYAEVIARGGEMTRY